MKRLLDIVVSLLLLIALMPLMLGVAVAVRIKIGSPVLFTQIRPGLNGKPFRMIKFRTMLMKMDGHGKLLEDSERLTSFGKRLRASSLDELPELWNVLKGDMSMVGPRPLLVDYLPHYNQEESKRHNVKPGITGYAQINGRNSLDWGEKLKLDVCYVESNSIFLDLKILFKTISTVIKRDGINHSSSATMPSFIEYAKLRNKNEKNNSPEF